MFDFMDDFFPDWDDIALAGAIAEELADEERKAEREANEEER